MAKLFRSQINGSVTVMSLITISCVSLATASLISLGLQQNAFSSLLQSRLDKLARRIELESSIQVVVKHSFDSSEIVEERSLLRLKRNRMEVLVPDKGFFNLYVLADPNSSRKAAAYFIQLCNKKVKNKNWCKELTVKTTRLLKTNQIFDDHHLFMALSTQTRKHHHLLKIRTFARLQAKSFRLNPSHFSANDSNFFFDFSLDQHSELQRVVKKSDGNHLAFLKTLLQSKLAENIDVSIVKLTTTLESQCSRVLPSHEQEIDQNQLIVCSDSKRGIQNEHWI